MSTRQRLPRVLVVEDDDDVRLTTCLVLQAQGFEVIAVDGGAAALASLAESGPTDVAVVDLAMPGIDGIRLTRMIREKYDFPILMLTARDLPSDIVAGLDAGADDYVTKPFDAEVLGARLRALIRRRTGSPTPSNDAPAPEAYGRITIDVSGLVVTYDGLPIGLSATEFRLLEYLTENVGRVVTRSQILHAVWGTTAWTDARVVDTNIGRLRAKLDPGAIETVRGFGYKLVVT